MSTHDLKARLIYVRTRDAIDAHLVIVFAVLAVSHWIERCTCWTIKKFVQSLRHYRQVNINTGTQQIAAEQPVSEEIRRALAQPHQIPRG